MLDLKVVGREAVAQNIVSLELATADGGPLPAYTAGAHIDVHLGQGLVRQYSLCGEPGASAYRIAVLLDPASRGGSRAVHDQLGVGSTVGIEGPRNHFELEPSAKRSMLFAGGIGITPILAMAQTLAGAGATFDLHYCARTPAKAAFVDRMEKSSWAGRVQMHYSDVEVPGQGKLDFAATLGAPEPDVHIYACGPRPFMDALIATARDQGWPDAQIHHEYFSGADPHSADDRSFDVELARSGRVIRVEAAQTVVEALTAHGVEIPTSCEQGVCGTCLTKVLSGRPDHKDYFLTDAERVANDQFLPCCSRSLDARLVLDI